MDQNIDLSDNTEINDALKEFETKVSAEQIKKVDFVSKTSESPKMIQWVMKVFGIKEEKKSEYLLLGFVIVAILFSLFLLFGVGNGGRKEPTLYQEDLTDTVRQTIPKEVLDKIPYKYEK